MGAAILAMGQQNHGESATIGGSELGMYSLLMSKPNNQKALLEQIAEAMSADQYRLRRRLLNLLKKPNHEQELERWQNDLQRSCARVDTSLKHSAAQL